MVFALFVWGLCLKHLSSQFTLGQNKYRTVPLLTNISDPWYNFFMANVETAPRETREIPRVSLSEVKKRMDTMEWQLEKYDWITHKKSREGISLYYSDAPLENDTIEDTVRRETFKPRRKLHEATYNAGIQLEEQYGEQLQFPDPDFMLGKVEDSSSVKPEPGFPFGPVAIAEMLDGTREPSRVLEVFGRPYLQEVIQGRIPFPNRLPYFRIQVSPEVTGALGIKPLASITERQRFIDGNSGLIFDSVNLNREKVGGDAHARLETAREAIVEGIEEPPGAVLGTRTRFREGSHVGLSRKGDLLVVEQDQPVNDGIINVVFGQRDPFHFVNPDRLAKQRRTAA